MPYRLAIDPAQTLRTTHSTGIIFIAFTSDSRSFNTRTKCVAMPAAASLPITYALILLLVSPFCGSLASLTPSNADTSSR